MEKKSQLSTNTMFSIWNNKAQIIIKIQQASLQRHSLTHFLDLQVCICQQWGRISAQNILPNISPWWSLIPLVRSKKSGIVSVHPSTFALMQSKHWQLWPRGPLVTSLQSFSLLSNTTMSLSWKYFLFLFAHNPTATNSEKKMVSIGRWAPLFIPRTVI